MRRQRGLLGVSTFYRGFRGSTPPPPGRSWAFFGALLLWLALALALSGVSSDDKPKGPELKVWPQPAMVIAAAGSNAAVVTIRVEITGTLTEAWYCPEVTWLWPDDTKSKEESDCVVWEEAYEDGDRPQIRWSQRRGFPAGEWPVTVELRKAGKLIARQMATVRVAG